MSHDIFRYVPQIEQMGLDLPPEAVMQLAERDRQLEDYLSTLHPGEAGGGEGVPGAISLASTAEWVPGADATFVGRTGDPPWLGAITLGDPRIVISASGIAQVTQSGVYLISTRFMFQHPGLPSWRIQTSERFAPGPVDPSTVGYERSDDWDYADNPHVTVKTAPRLAVAGAGATLVFQAYRGIPPPAFPSAGGVTADIIRLR